MGKRTKKFKPKNSSNKKVKEDWNNIPTLSENPLFRQYYELQLQLPAQQFETFWTLMRQKLPVVFRINPSCPNYTAFQKKVQNENFLSSMVDMKNPINEEISEKQWLQPKQIPKLDVLKWYPHSVLHQLNTSKQMFKKSKILNALHQYLQKAFDAGLIARQELVSMLPPLYLDIHPDDIVLDMCAAPGSKTSQLLQMIYGQKKHLAKGCVIANDADYSRAQMLIHQINRSGTAGMAVINHPGQFMPQLYQTKVNHIKQKFQFDKILCDVPCSGDGATRKIPIKWSKWHTSDGVSLHPLQLSILMKSVNLLKRGGLIVYSTCSLNPIQNQAVLSGLFRKVSKGLQIIDIHEVYDIKGRRGMLNWKVCATQTVQQSVQGQEKPRKIKRLVTYNSPEETNNMKLKISMFPPTLQQAQNMQLHHSMRMLPHDQNSGGFFLALMKKHEDFEWNYNAKDQKQDQKDKQQNFVDNNLPEIDNPVFEEGREQKEEQNQSEGQIEDEKVQEKIIQNYQVQLESQKIQVEEQLQNIVIKQLPKQEQKLQNKSKKSRNQLKYERFQNINESEFESISKFYVLDPSIKHLLYVRDIQGNTRKKVLLVSQGVKTFLDADTEKRIKLINMGCKVFEKGKQSFAGHQCLFRLSQEGIHFLLPFMKARKIKVSMDFFRSVIKINSLVHENIEDEEVKSQMKEMSQGSFCLYIEEQIDGKQVLDAVVGQNFKNSFHLLVGKEQLASLNLRYL